MMATAALPLASSKMDGIAQERTANPFAATVFSLKAKPVMTAIPMMATAALPLAPSKMDGIAQERTANPFVGTLF